MLQLAFPNKLVPLEVYYFQYIIYLFFSKERKEADASSAIFDCDNVLSVPSCDRSISNIVVKSFIR